MRGCLGAEYMGEPDRRGRRHGELAMAVNVIQDIDHCPGTMLTKPSVPAPLSRGIFPTVICFLARESNSVGHCQ